MKFHTDGPDDPDPNELKGVDDPRLHKRQHVDDPKPGQKLGRCDDPDPH